MLKLERILVIVREDQPYEPLLDLLATLFEQSKLAFDLLCLRRSFPSSMPDIEDSYKSFLINSIRCDI